MKLATFQPVTLLDYTGHIACTVFTVGCNFRCPYCYNVQLVIPSVEASSLNEKAFFDFLRRRVGKLDSVAITGGEPTLHEDLPIFISKIRDLGFGVKLDTNGTNPKMLSNLLKAGLVDYVAMDIKAPWPKYDQVTRAKGFAPVVQESLDILKKSAPHFEVRTTIHPAILSLDDIVEIAKNVTDTPLYVLQNYVPAITIDETFSNSVGYSSSQMEEIRNAAQKVSGAKITIKNV